MNTNVILLCITMSKNNCKLALSVLRFASAKLERNNNMMKRIIIKNPSLSSDNEGNEEE